MRTNIDHRTEFQDFTESAYRDLLRLAKSHYRFCRFGESIEGRHVLWRHDLDASMERALRLAEIERDEGVAATYFLFPRCLFYNLLNPLTQAMVRRIISLGHDIALHFDLTQLERGVSRERMLDAIAAERDLLVKEFGPQPTAVSFHLYGVLEEPAPDDEELAGLVNAYSLTLRQRYGYVSDSNGIWLHRRLRDVLAHARDERLQVLTHPEWWTPEVMAPRARLQRAIDEHAALMGRWYDETVARSGRPNFR
jgi:hypothetical protein